MYPVYLQNYHAEYEQKPQYNTIQIKRK